MKIHALIFIGFSFMGQYAVNPFDILFGFVMVDYLLNLTDVEKCVGKK